MDLVYSVTRKTIQENSSSIDRLLKSSTVFSVSTKNTVAFSSCIDFDCAVGRTYKSHVYVADFNLPWKAYKIFSHTDEINCIEWDVSGTRLIIADVSGNIQLWSMKEYILNDWKLISTNSFLGEYFLCAAWFHSGKRISLNSEKKESALYLEKFAYVKFGPTLRNAGGRPKDGCVLISSSGMVCVVIPALDSPVVTGSDWLGAARHRLNVVDLCYAKNGDFLIVASDGQASSPIHCYQVAIKLNNEKCNISCTSLPRFYLNAFINSNSSEQQVIKVTHVKFVVKEAADAVVIASSGSEGSQVELWELKEKPISFHKMFRDQNMDADLKTVNWQHNATVVEKTSVVAMTTPCSTIYDCNPPPSYVLIAYSDGDIKCFFRESLQPVCSVNVNFGSTNSDETGDSSSRCIPEICDLHLTYTGSTLVAIDSMSQLFLYRLSPVVDPGGPMTANYLVTLLEYCLITGIDWWDVLLGLRSVLVDTVSERLTYTFGQQPQNLQMFWFNRFMMMKCSLYRCLSNGQNRAGDCHASLILNAIGTMFKSLLRPTDLANHDKDPAENLAATISGKNGETDIDNVLVHLENKEFIVEPQVLQSLQQLIQWVADFTLYLLASIPQQHQDMMMFPGCGLISDTKALTTLQELLVIIRMWGLIKPSCLPVFTKTSGTLDVLKLMFKLLSKTLMSSLSDPDETLLDECCLLVNQVQIHQMDLPVNSNGVVSPAMFKNALPLQFEYNTEPDFMSYRNIPAIPDGVVFCNQKTDIIRHMYLGLNPRNIKLCTRCAGMSILTVTSRSLVTRAWDQRWMKNCPCSGHWITVKKVKSS